MVEFAAQALKGAAKVGGMDISTFTGGERHALAQASAMVLPSRRKPTEEHGATASLTPSIRLLGY
jgi:hypothetical protein